MDDLGRSLESVNRSYSNNQLQTLGDSFAINVGSRRYDAEMANQIAAGRLTLAIFVIATVGLCAGCVAQGNSAT